MISVCQHMKKALFLDRDGVLTQLVYDTMLGIVRTPLNVQELKLTPYAIEFLQEIKKLGYSTFIVSNQPDIGLGRISQKTFDTFHKKITNFFSATNGSIDGYYYCFHHPFAIITKYKKNCDCQKPKPGLLLQAQKEHEIDLSHSWMIGDGVNDIIAGHEAGCKTMLITNSLESGYLSIIQKQLGNIHPTNIVKSLKEAITVLQHDHI